MIKKALTIIQTQAYRVRQVPALFFSGCLCLLVLSACSLRKQIVKKKDEVRVLDSIVFSEKTQELQQAIASQFNKDEEEVVETKIVRLTFDTNTTMKEIKQESAPVLSAEIEYKVKRKRTNENQQTEAVKQENIVEAKSSAVQEIAEVHTEEKSKITRHFNWWILGGTIFAGALLGYLILRLCKKINFV